MMCIRYEPRQPYAMHMAAKHSRTRHGRWHIQDGCFRHVEGK